MYLRMYPYKLTEM